MIKKKKISDAPLTYQIFEDLPTLDPIPLGTVVYIRDELWAWDSRWGANRGDNVPLEIAMKLIHTCAARSDFFRAVKKRGMRT